MIVIETDQAVAAKVMVKSIYHEMKREKETIQLETTIEKMMAREMKERVKEMARKMKGMVKEMVRNMKGMVKEMVRKMKEIVKEMVMETQMET